jgi:hypothetical protein
MDPKESFPAGIPHPSPSPPGNHGDGKLGVGERYSLIDIQGICSYIFENWVIIGDFFEGKGWKQDEFLVGVNQAL